MVEEPATSEEPETRDDEEDELRIEAENIEDYGAEPNPQDPDIESAVRNINAIKDAADEAGEGGAIYIPPNKYYFGHEGNRPNIAFGSTSPTDISIYGSSPKESSLALTEHMKEDTSHVLFKYDKTSGDFAIRNIQIDGNYENLGNLVAADRASRAIELDGSGTLDCCNVHFRGIDSSAIRLRGLDASISHCLFEEIGIGSRNDGGSGHGVETHTGVGTQVTIEDCLFNRIGSFALNWRYGDGFIVMNRCFVKGTGTGIIKLSAGDRLEIRNCYLEANTPWVENNINYPESEISFHGRHFINSLFERGDRVPTLVTENVEFRNCTHEAFKIRNDPIEWDGDMIAIHNATNNIDGAVIQADSSSGGALRNVDVNQLSIHDSDGVLFNAADSDGVIRTLARGGNEGLGDTGNIAIQSDELRGPPLDPAVVTEKYVGLDDELRCIPES